MNLASEGAFSAPNRPPIPEQTAREIATGEDARRILKIGTQYNTVEETLLNLGLPPNRKGDEKGFLLPKTDGKRYILSEDKSEVTA